MSAVSINAVVGGGNSRSICLAPGVVRGAGRGASREGIVRRFVMRVARRWSRAIQFT